MPGCINCGVDVRNVDSLPEVTEICSVTGTGTFVKAMEMCTHRQAFKIGKPSPYVCDVIMNRHEVDPSKILMIGDRQVYI